MAFQAPSQERQSQNRKLLEQLEEQKKRLRGGHGGSGSGSSITTVTASTAAASGSASIPSSSVAPPGIPAVATPVSTLPPDSTAMTPQQRAALQHAHANSVGYFITQDSSFGNLILPVLPRYSDK